MDELNFFQLRQDCWGALDKFYFKLNSKENRDHLYMTILEIFKKYNLTDIKFKIETDYVISNRLSIIGERHIDSLALFAILNDYKFN